MRLLPNVYFYFTYMHNLNLQKFVLMLIMFIKNNLELKIRKSIINSKYIINMNEQHRNQNRESNILIMILKY